MVCFVGLGGGLSGLNRYSLLNEQKKGSGKCGGVSILTSTGVRNGRVLMMSSSSAASSAFNENPYRSLGVAEDATYDEIESAFQTLTQKYKSQPKKVMFYEIQKEKIFEDRLRQRMKGTLQPKVKESPYDKARRLALEKRTFKDYLPAPIKQLVKVPSKAYLQRTLITMGLCILVAFAIPQFAGSAIAIGFMASTYLLYTRGLPEVNREGMDSTYGPPPSPPVDRKVALKTVLLNLLVTGVFLGFAQLLLLAIPLPASILPDSIVATFMLIGMLTSCLFFQVNEE
uniref:J domain-containing protein n=1 Tax=Timspurckia oligopyrenoides TaxID=708627 RepID=A0A7S0ZGL1_9RHOD|mmetsp:Transcript_4441/g.7787  ORF Transcript_4441/g.7787 Transcript_4441/m.7787 type:complete len:285 (+) Transcript_4441:53-907(+)